MACDLETTIEESCTSGIGKIQDPIMLLKIIAYLMCEIADSGGGGGAALDVTGDPNGVLVSDHNQFAWDAVGKFLWVNEGVDGSTGPWHQIV